MEELGELDEVAGHHLEEVRGRGDVDGDASGRGRVAAVPVVARGDGVYAGRSKAGDARCPTGERGADFPTATLDLQP